MNISFTQKSVLILSFLVFLVSCGSQKPMVQDVNVQSVTDQGEVLVKMDAILNIGNVTLADLTLPIIAPRTQKEIGLISMYKDMFGQNKFEIEINLSAITNVEAIVAKLPNGNTLPLIRDNDVIAIPVSNKATVYLAFSNGVAAFGATVAISGLDSLGRSTGEVSLFPNFNIKNILGVAGIYTSRTAGENGFGIFADISNVIDTNNLNSNKTLLAQREEVGNDYLQLNYNSITPSRSTKKKLDSGLYKLHKRKAVL